MASEINPKPSFVICGLTRNSEKYIFDEIQRINRVFPKDVTRRWFVVESDSQDRTVDDLEKLSKTLNDFEFTSLGKLEETYSNRLERLAHCRNTYLSWAREIQSEFDYMLILDLDRLNKKLNWQSIEKTLESQVEWDVAFANQEALYYDMFALRHPVWSPSDPFTYKNFLRGIGYSEFHAGKKAIVDRMLRIPSHLPPIPVDSAFGGAAIYRASALKEGSYSAFTKNGEEVCEHVTFNLFLRNRGLKLYIFPNFINARWTEHTWKQMGILRFIRMPLRILFFAIGSRKGGSPNSLGKVTSDTKS